MYFSLFKVRCPSADGQAYDNIKRGEERREGEQVARAMAHSHLHFYVIDMHRCRPTILRAVPLLLSPIVASPWKRLRWYPVRPTPIERH